MRWSFKIAELRGIGIYVHATFLILIAIIVASHWAKAHDLARALEGAGFTLALFACIVLHELGHALMALRFGVRTRDITLYPIGGVARLERIPEAPRQELWVALAGPAVNVAIAVALGLVSGFDFSPRALEALAAGEGPLAARLVVVNVSLAAFNLLPAFPMDGGRVLRALLATRLAYPRATQIAASAGQAMALLFGLIGFFANPFLMFVALFVWIGAAQEAGQVEMRFALRGLRVSDAMETDFRAFSPAEPLGRAVEATLAGAQQDFPIVEAGRLVGTLTRLGLLDGLAKRGADSAIAESMTRSFETTAPNEPLEAVFARFEGASFHAVPVLAEGRIVGLLTLSNVGDLLAIRAALAGHRADRPRP